MSQQINLFNAGLLPRRELFSARNVAIGTALALLAVVGSGFAVSAMLSGNQQEFNRTDTELKAAQAQLAAISQQAASQAASPAMQAELDHTLQLLDARQNVITALAALGSKPDSPGFATYLRALARQSVNGLWLTRVVIGAAGGELQLNGRTVDRGLLADYVERLNAEKSFAGHGFGGLQMSQGVEPVTVAAQGTNANAATTAPAPVAATKPAPYIDFELSTLPSGDAGDKKS